MEVHHAVGTRFEEGFFRLILNNLRDYAVFAMDTEGVVISWNSGAEKVLGFREEEIRGLCKIRAALFRPGAESLRNPFPGSPKAAR